MAIIATITMAAVMVAVGKDMYKYFKEILTEE